MYNDWSAVMKQKNKLIHQYVIGNNMYKSITGSQMAYIIIVNQTSKNKTGTVFFKSKQLFIYF